MSWLRPIAAGLVAAALGILNEGCHNSRSAEAAQAAYIMELTGCVERAKTKEESVACRAAVNRKYGLCEPGDWPRISPCD